MCHDERLVKVGKGLRIKIPKEFCHDLNINCNDFLSAKVVNGKLVFALKVRVRGEVILSKHGEKMMKKALDDIEKGRIEKV
ncbi:MAG: hypothetical protein WC306_02625 [Candidatus Paceibacterota bacterium]|jgi:bifunctional DNA-binding transcriptional regulator/antitoxin component of YhaV-PrlF toxin-antitoxin module